MTFVGHYHGVASVCDFVLVEDEEPTLLVANAGGPARIIPKSVEGCRNDQTPNVSAAFLKFTFSGRENGAFV